MHPVDTIVLDVHTPQPEKNLGHYEIAEGVNKYKLYKESFRRHKVSLDLVQGLTLVHYESLLKQSLPERVYVFCFGTV